jgi:hypothetical protein
VRQVRQHKQQPLIAESGEASGPLPLGEREPWFVAFIDLLVNHGADRAVTVAAVDRLARPLRRDLRRLVGMGPPAATLSWPAWA